MVSLSTVVCAVKFITYSLSWFGCNVLLMIYLCYLSYLQHGSQLMCLCLSVSEAEAAQKEEEVMEMMNTRQAAELLSSKVEKGQLQLDRKKKGCGILVKLTDKEHIEGSVFDKDIKHG